MSTPLKVDTSSSEKKMKSPRKSLNTKTILEGSQKLETNKLAKHSLLSGSAKIMEKDKVVTEATKTMSLHELNSNLLAIFDQWDSDNSDELDLRELQVGFYNAGIFIKHKKMLRYLRKCSSRKNHNQCVRANEFSKFMQMIAGNNTKILRVIVQKIAVAIPRERVRPSHYLDIKDTDGERKKSKSGNEDDDNILDAFDNVVSAEVLMQNNIFDPRIMFEYVTFQRGIFPAVFAFLAWQMGFSIFYWAYDDFRFDRAFYYSAQAGLSVGFGSLSEEYEGGLIDSAPCGMSTLNISQENHSTHNATRTSNTLNSLNTGDTNYTSSTLRSSGEYDVSKFVTILNVILGSSVIGGALGYFVDLVLQDKESWYEKIKNVDEIEKHKKEIEDEKAKQGCCTAKIETLHLELIEVYRANEAECKITLFVICLLSASIIFGMVEEDFTFITAMYYGVTSMSTAGLQGPNPESRASMIFTGLLVLIGVPTYGVCLGFFANALVSKAQAKREADAMHSAISKSEFLYVSLSIHTIHTHTHTHTQHNTHKTGMLQSLRGMLSMVRWTMIWIGLIFCKWNYFVRAPSPFPSLSLYRSLI